MPLPPELEALAARVSNWGRWGGDDERGTLNLVTPEAVLRGAACVRRGAVFPLALPFEEDGPQTGAIPGRDNPKLTSTGANVPYSRDPDGVRYSDDRVEMGTQASTHWDALAHAGYAGHLYNGVPASAVTEAGAGRCGIEHVGPVVTRGVLLDVARAMGVDRLDAGYAITGDDLDRALAATGLAVEAGDAVLVRTGQLAVLRAGEKDAYRRETSGLSTKSVEWLWAHDVAAVAVDTFALEVWPPEYKGVMTPVHMLHLRDMGLLQGQLWDLDALAADCAADGVWEFLLSATPIPFTGACGGPVAPVAVK